MNYFKLLPILFILPLFIVNCDKEPNEPESKGLMTAPIDDVAWEAKTKTANYVGEFLTIKGVAENGQTIIVEAKVDKIGWYNLNWAYSGDGFYMPVEDGSQGQYTTSDALSPGGTLKVTKLDATNKLVSGTFTFTGINLFDMVEVTNGVFTDIPFEGEVYNPSNTDNSITCKIDGQSWKPISVYAMESLGQIVVSATKSSNSILGLSIVSSINVGSYTPSSFGDKRIQYVSNSETFMIENGSLVITEHNKTGKVIKGTFNGTAESVTGSATHSITDGSFLLKY
ncbi:MAG: hypothetical protein HOG05_12465 [Bacteroidetes bacterium]|nr:hypothetical protein [Bacteroidota bacterium]